MVDLSTAAGMSEAPARTLRLGTRGSALAIWQTENVIDRLTRYHPDLKCEVHIISTQGDRDKETPLSIIGGQGIFIKELERSILAGEVDCAVHSLKDMPGIVPDGLTIEAILDRHDPRDVLISRHEGGLSGLPEGATVGTSSRRRMVQLQEARPDINTIELRGNVDTRINKALDADGPYDAAILAAAGVLRMEREDTISQYLDPGVFTPAPGQAALAVECRQDDLSTRALLAAIHDDRVALAVEVERAALRGIGGGCRSPIGAYATWESSAIRLQAMLASDDLSKTVRVDEVLDPSDAIAHATELAVGMLDRIG